MDNILERIAEKTRERIAEEERKIPLTELKARIKEKAAAPDFAGALKSEGMSFICEVKKASPSKGIIAENFPYLEIAKDYERAGAAAISCLTEPFWFMGADRYVEEIAKEVSIPILRKDFTISEYMVYQARAMGASAVLLICAILSDTELRSFRELSRELGMNALVECHDETEVERALNCGADIVGVNNRDLRTFKVDVNTSLRLRKLVPKDCIYVSESGIKGASDIQRLYENKTDAVLIGETLMRAADKKAAIRQLRGDAHE